MDGIKITNVENKVLQLGDCEYEAGSLSVPANTTYATGTLLKRAASGEAFEIAATADTAIAVLPCDVENTTAAAKTAGIRALVWGKVRQDLLHYNAAPTTALTPAQRDALRSYGIVCHKVTNWAQTDNQ
jgi:hypothetical protein